MRGQLLAVMVSAWAGLCVAGAPGARGVAQPEAEYGRVSPKQVAMARLSRLHGVLRSHYERTGGLPAEGEALLESGAVASRSALLDARQPVLIEDPLGMRGAADGASVFRVGSAWRDGPVATSDLPRDGEWLILTGAGEVYAQPVDPAWLGSYTAKELSDAEREAAIDRRAAMLGVLVSDGETDGGRAGVGVDELIPGFYRHGFSIPFSPLGGETDLRRGDLIVTCDGVRVESVAGLEALLDDRSVSMSGQPGLEVIRGGRLEYVKPLAMHWFSGIRASEPRARRDAALAMLAADDPDSALDIDCILLGVLDLDALQAREGAAERLGPEKWVRAWEHGVGPVAAVRRIDEWLREPGVSERRRRELYLLRSEQLRRQGRFEDALRPIDRVAARVAAEIERELREADPEDRGEYREDLLRAMQDVWIARAGVLVDQGRVEEAIELAREVVGSGVAHSAMVETLMECVNAMFVGGYPRAGLDVVREHEGVLADEPGIADALPLIEEYVRGLEREVGVSAGSGGGSG